MIEDTRYLTAGLTPDVALFEDPATSHCRIASSPPWGHSPCELAVFSVDSFRCVTAASTMARSMILTSIFSGAAAAPRPGREIALSTGPVLVQGWPRSVDKPAGPSPAQNRVLCTGYSIIRAPGISVAWRVTTARSLGDEGRGARRISRAKRCRSGDGTERRENGEPGGVVIGAGGP